MNVISESGLYALVLTSRKPQAKAFRRWVTGKVLPEIRRTGAYRWSGRRPETQRGKGFTINLPEPGRYVTTIERNGSISTMATGAMREDAEVSDTDTRLLCYRIKVIQCHWQQRHETVSVSDGTGPVKRLDQLDVAVLEAGQLADAYLEFLHPRRRRTDVQ